MTSNLRRLAPWLLFAVAVVWGFAFPMQQIAGRENGPFTVNATRFFLALIALVPFVQPWRHRVVTWPAGALSLFLIAGSSLQQVGLMQTSSANAGFITGTYVVFVPLICWLLFQETLRRAVVVGVTLAFAGLSLLSFPTSAPTNLGDLWVLASALSFAAHTVLIGRIGRKSDPLQLAFGQYLFSFLGCALIATLVESSRGIHLEAAIGPFIYLGVVSTAFGYTLQVVGQRFVSSTAAGIILSLESVFAALGGFLLLGESLSLQAKIGCGLLLAGAIVSQTPTKVSPPFSSIREAKSAENAGA